MQQDLGDISKRLMSCKAWRWMPGMQAIWPNGNLFRVGQTSGIDVEKDLPNYPSNGWGDNYPDRTRGSPDLEDPATGGLILHLLGEICSTETKLSSLSSGVDEWEVWTIFGRSEGKTLGEAAAKALIFLEERSS